MLTKPIRTGRGSNLNRPSRSKEREDNRVTGYPSGHILSKQNTCLVDKRGSQHVSQVEGASKVWGCAEVEETIETHLIPRRSTTKAQHLLLYPATSREVVDLRMRVAVKDEQGNIVLDMKRFATIYRVTTPKGESNFFTSESNAKAFQSNNGGTITERKQYLPLMIRGSNPRVITRSDRTLLQQGNPFKPLEDDPSIKRETHRSKRKISDKSTYKNYLGEIDDRKPEAVPSLDLDVDDPIFS